MSRLSRITVPGLPHHVTQRGNRRQLLFTETGDYALYRDLMAERCRANGVVCTAYCLMPNHVHLLLTPATPEGLSRAVGEAHRRYSAFVNARARVTGHVFQGRFASAVMDEAHWLAAVRYLALNPVRAGLVTRPEAWPWSSVPAHLSGHDDDLATVAPLLGVVPRPRELFEAPPDAAALAFETEPSAVGRPLGGPAFVADLEVRLGRTLARGKPGRKPGVVGDNK